MRAFWVLVWVCRFFCFFRWWILQYNLACIAHAEITNKSCQHCHSSKKRFGKPNGISMPNRHSKTPWCYKILSMHVKFLTQLGPSLLMIFFPNAAGTKGLLMPPIDAWHSFFNGAKPTVHFHVQSVGNHYFFRYFPAKEARWQGWSAAPAAIIAALKRTKAPGGPKPKTPTNTIRQLPFLWTGPSAMLRITLPWHVVVGPCHQFYGQTEWLLETDIRKTTPKPTSNHTLTKQKPTKPVKKLTRIQWNTTNKKETKAWSNVPRQKCIKNTSCKGNLACRSMNPNVEAIILAKHKFDMLIWPMSNSLLSWSHPAKVQGAFHAEQTVRCVCVCW